MRIKACKCGPGWHRGFFKGCFKSPYRGFWVEFSEYPEYSPVDDPRYLDWRLFTAVRIAITSNDSRRGRPPPLSRGRHEPVDRLSFGRIRRQATARDGGGDDHLFPRSLSSAITPSGCFCKRFEDKNHRYLPARSARPRPPSMAALERDPGGRATDLVGPLGGIARKFSTQAQAPWILISDYFWPRLTRCKRGTATCVRAGTMS